MKVLKSLTALTIVVFIPFALMIWIRIHQSTGFAAVELIQYPLLFGGGSIIVLLLLKRYFLQESLNDFNSGEGNWKTDILWGLALTAAYFLLFIVERPLLSGVLTRVPNMEMLDLMLSMRDNPVYLILFFGPVLWIGIALYEELIRVFLLTSLWKFSEKMGWMILVIVLTSALIGLTHWSQGSYGVVTIGIKSLVSCFFFFRYRRLLPLVIAHVLYDGIQVALLLITYPQG
ncbi:MAG: CPBP family intramembrane metalloprotease [Bacteroidetes bacterium]|nr:MAG: CPBP family intramembrane metalloprotease [Bacteroidota bacterium]